MTKIKICGITRLEDAQLCAELGVDYVGFVFVRESKRYVDARWVGNLPLLCSDGRLGRRALAQNPIRAEGVVAHDEGLASARRPRRPSLHRSLRVGVFRDSPLDEVLHTAATAQLDLIQLHGSEDEEYVRAIDLPVVKVIQANQNTRAPYVMFDSGGGTGRTFDWSLVEEYRPRQPFFLAGGLTPENVAEAIRVTRPYAVDVSSGVESAPGIKNHQKIREFIQKVRQP